MQPLHKSFHKDSIFVLHLVPLDLKEVHIFSEVLHISLVPTNLKVSQQSMQLPQLPYRTRGKAILKCDELLRPLDLLAHMESMVVAHR